MLDLLVPTDINRGAITLPDSVKEKVRGHQARRRGSYDPLRSPPPELLSFAEEAVRGRASVD